MSSIHSLPSKVNGTFLSARRPPMWEMVKEAVTNTGGRATHGEISDFIHRRWDRIGSPDENGVIKPVN